MSNRAAKGPVLLALSGGVDSAVAARLLLADGYDVQGLVIRFSPQHDGAVAAAQTAAQELGIPLHVARCEADFERAVVAPFCAEYAAGRTPNPCVLCNPLVKFKTLAETADALGIGPIASGHYARLAQKDGGWRVRCAKSPRRDQSYMLYRLGRAVLERLLLPVGGYGKDEIRALARTMGLSGADTPDSQDICFVPGGDYVAFVAARGYTGAAGRFIAPDGRVLGPHRGVVHYTVGQRKHLGVALGAPVYVRCIEANGDIRLAWAGQTGVPSVRLSQVVCAEAALCRDGGRFQVKIRSVAVPVPCTVKPLGDGLRVVFDAPQRAPAPGQHAVLYTGELVAGGGVMEPDDAPCIEEAGTAPL